MTLVRVTDPGAQPVSAVASPDLADCDRPLTGRSFDDVKTAVIQRLLQGQFDQGRACREIRVNEFAAVGDVPTVEADAVEFQFPIRPVFDIRVDSIDVVIEPDEAEADLIQVVVAKLRRNSLTAGGHGQCDRLIQSRP